MLNKPGNEILDGITPEEVGQAWDNYQGDHDFDQWLREYENIRRNSRIGRETELRILDELGVGRDNKNTQVFTDPNTGNNFIPDRVVSQNPPHFVEIKDFKKTVLYPGSNAGTQLQYLIGQAKAGNPGTFDLYIADPRNLSTGIANLIEAARLEQVEVNIRIPDADGRIVLSPDH